MGTYETAYWLTDTWGMSRRESRSGAYHPYRPDMIAGSRPSRPLPSRPSLARSRPFVP